MSYIHLVKIDKKTGEVISCAVAKSDIKPNHKPLAECLLNRLENNGTIPLEKAQ